MSVSAPSERLGRLIGGGALILIGLLQLLDNVFAVEFGAWVWIIGLAVAAVAFGYVYLKERQVWAAIVTYVTGVLAVFLFLVTQANLTGNLVPAVILAAIAVPFVYAWWRDRKQWGLLIPAYVLLAIIPILYFGDTAEEGKLVPAYVMLAIGLPFIAAFAFTRQWPLLIPGGIMLAIGAFFLFDAVETFATAMAILVPVALIGLGVLLLVRPESLGAGDKSKRKNG